MNTQTYTNVVATLERPRYVIHNGVRMSYEEWLDMREKEMN